MSENHSTITVAVIAGAGYVPGAGDAGEINPGAAELTILDDDYPPTNVVIDVLAEIGEGAGTLEVSVTATTTVNLRPRRGVTFTMSSNSDTAESPEDFTPLFGGLVFFRPGEDWTATTDGDSNPVFTQTVTFSIAINDDVLDEPDESFSLRLQVPPVYPRGAITLPANRTRVVTILDNDDEPTVSMKATTVSVGEDVGTVSVCAVLSTASGWVTKVSVATADSGATAGMDYTALASDAALTFDVGSTEQCIDVTVTDDSDTEQAEAFTVTLGDRIHLAEGTDLVTTITVEDDDAAAPEMSITAGTSPVTEGTPATFTLDVSPKPGSTTTYTVTYTVAESEDVVAGSDEVTGKTIAFRWDSNSGSLCYIPTDTGGCRDTVRVVSVPTSPDTVDEPDSVVTVTLTAVSAVKSSDNTAVTAPTLPTPAAAMVTVRDDDEANAAPVFTSGSTAAFSAPENAIAAGTVVATDADSGDDIESYAVTGGADQAKFSIGAMSGALTFQTAPNFESPTDVASTTPQNVAANNEYIVVVTATGGTGDREMTAAQTITVTVTNVEEAGTVTLSAAQPAVDAALTATLSDPDGGVTSTTWVWEKSADGQNNWSAIGGATAASYTPVAGDVSQYLRATANYTDGHGSGKDAQAVSDNAVAAAPVTNAAPTFTSGSTAAFSAPENGTAAGTVAATDTDSGDGVAYTLTGGADQAKFSIGAMSGALTFNTAPNFESPTDVVSTSPTNAAGNNEYIVVVTATGGTGDREMTAAQTVTVTVTDVDEKPATPAAPTVAATANSNTSLDVSWTAPSPNGGPAITGYNLRYRQGTSGAWTNGPQTVSGTSTAIGSLTAGTSYQVQVQALNGETPSDWSPAGTGSTSSPTNNVPTFTDGASTTRSVAENTTASANIGTAIAATDADSGDTLRYTLGGTDMASFAIVSTSGQLQTSAALDYETKSSYAVTVSVSDGNGGSDSIDVTITVTNVEEAGSVTLSAAQPAVDAALTATLSDPDGGVTGTTWVWHKSADGQNNWSAISGATAASYTPVAGDVGQYLRATANYTDGHGAGKDAQAVSANAVQAAPATKPTVTITGPTSIREGNTVTVTVRRTGPTTAALRGGVNFTDTGNAENDGSYAFIIPVDGTSNTVRFTVLDDGAVPASRTITAALSTGYDTYRVGTPASVTITVVDKDALVTTNTAPGAPRTLTAAPGDGEVVLTWTAPASTGGEAITHYEYRHKATSSLPFVSSDSWTSAGTVLTATVGSLTNGTPYSFEVRAVNTVGAGPAATTSATPTPTATAPGVPRTLTAAAGDGEVVLTWTAPASTGGEAITHYEYRHKATSSLPFVSSDSWTSAGTVLTATVGSLTNGTPYSFEVRAVNTVGEGAAATTSATPTAAANNAPVFTEGTSTTRSVAENTASGQNIGTAIAATDADSGDTLRYTLGGTDMASFAIVSTSGQLQTSAALDFETTSSYAVTVSVSDGNGGSDSIDVTITVTDVNEQPGRPAAPSVGATANSDTSLDVSWTAPGLNGGPAITGYDLQYRPGTSGSFTNGPQNVSGTSTMITGLAAGTSYQVQVRALNGETPSDWSPSGTGSTLAVAPAPGVPRTLTATAGDGQVVLTWTVPANTVSVILRYEHRHKVTSAANFPPTWTSAGTVRTATVGNLTNGTPYSFEVRAVNTVGAGTAATASATPLATARATQPTLTIDVDPNRFGEAAGSARICVVPSAPSTQRITVQAATADGTATAPGDYISYSSTVALQPQQQRACFTVTLVDDAEVEGDETFTVTLSNPVNATLGTPAVATVTIVDNDQATQPPRTTNNAPAFTEGPSATRSVAENTASGQDIGTAIEAMDADGDTLRYTLGGTDMASFAVVSTSGQLRTRAALDYETKPSYAVTVSVSDGNGGTDSISVTISVTDVDEPPPGPEPEPVPALPGVGALGLALLLLGAARRVLRARGGV